ncbi:MAG: DUF4350 domain-containing protein [Bacteroidota bacterium]|uniref:DUF4350 domain-containing protein n=1 Tax=Flagellimonas profundi TaxID=2915620 RepID=A0ABS3FA57_9FLAO|nr:DUF4350 domain-containing protein [Allomuricauda profundi]MBO0340034.1 DUF4350 domain-containing protein [Allomuricauda profundi]MEC7772727.1 DUF4350 domain-containing protein [Bacteroidota bacterium]
MSRKGWIYLIIGVLTLAAIFAMEYNKPKKVNWFPSYVSHHKIPYGTYVLNNLMEKYFPDHVQQVQKPPFELLTRTDSIRGTYFFVNETVSFGEAELNALLDWVDQGNTLFVASDRFEQKLLDTLHLEQTNVYNDGQLEPLFYLELSNPKLTSSTYKFTKDYYTIGFDQLDTLQTTVLAQVYTRSDSTDNIKKHVNTIKQPFGNGEILLTSFPKAFTNYFILKDTNQEYTAGLLSYLDTDKQIYMDNFHKSGKSFYTSPMYLFLNTKEFKWAYYLVLIGALVYIIFEGKRKQRAIPVVQPLKNQTLAFTRTIADMYFEKGELHLITKHKIDYFLEYLRSKLHISTQDLQDEMFLRNLSMRSNTDLKDVKILMGTISKLREKQYVTETELKNLNQKIQAFKANVDGK